MLYRDIERVEVLKLRELSHALYHTPLDEPIAVNVSTGERALTLELPKPMSSSLINLIAMLPQIARYERV